MNEFVLLYRGGPDPTQMSKEEMGVEMNRWMTWFAKLSEEGKIKDMGSALQRTGKVVVAGGAIMDGPFSEGKEIIGGYSIIKANDIDEAAEIAKGCPSGILEVRPVQAM